ncbi:nitrate reductase molybdenum cofactor assembly chaperone [Isoptericola sp. NEAU-Y5]|uniref:Nitrate reductase molybdenum cofactor assembly chaperone n=1 Tax=Isoptericola luteus TaxID=2879484 RepID=A0ABS7ZJG4_9MICO|nr:nitrate reductase molybdenum cofactor assembly chaperone [Isoptericola sp. NEAU-Y5]MCA5895169.1 nitrate reductase molybdenum cofactor assembly chaperone [Isoptericola sp. NEAU-Y5]
MSRLAFLPRPGVRAKQLDPLAPVPLDDGGRAVAHMAASLLLAYPDDDTLAAAPTVRDAVAGLPVPVRDRLAGLATTLLEGDPVALRADYVATFDLKRRCAMYLSYYAAGDTRRRGHALVRFVEAYRAAGFEATDGELPDYLPTVLELSARGDADGARIAGTLLAAHRDGIEVLRSALASLGSPWTAAVEAVCLTLPPVDAATAARVADLVTAGPPAELVGLSGYGNGDELPWE